MKTTLKKLLFILDLSQKREVAIIILLLLLGVFLEMVGLGILMPFFTLISSNNIAREYPFFGPFLTILGNPSHSETVFIGVLLLVAVYVVKAVYLYFLFNKQYSFSSNLTAKISQKLFDGYLKMPYEMHLDRNSAILLRNIQIEVNSFNAVLQSLMTVTTELIIIFGSYLVLLFVEPFGALIVSFILIFTSVLFNIATKKIIIKWGKQRQEYDGLLTQHLQQGLGGVKEINLMGRQNYFIQLFNLVSNKKARIVAKVATFQQIPRLYLELLTVVGLAVLIFLLIAKGKLLSEFLPVLGVFVGAAFRMIPSINRIVGGLQNLRYGKAALDIFYSEFSAIEKNPAINRDECDLFIFSQVITLKNVSFKYQSSSGNTLTNISISIQRGESVGFIGESGSGKSTLIDVILGLFEPLHGSLEVDGKNIKKIIGRWQRIIGYVPQTVYLTDDSLIKNVAFGINTEDIDKEAVMRAITAARLDSFVNSHPDGLDMHVGERGIKLSGGQRQRIGIARALYHDPQVLVLDEATSALDTETETSVMNAVNALHGTKTIIIVAHRISTVEKCDKLFVLNYGRIVLEGEPKDILTRNTLLSKK